MVTQNEPVVRIGIVGTGFGGRVQVPGFLKLPGVEIAGILSTGRRETAEKLAAELKIGRVCGSFEEMLQLPGLDAVSVVTPPYLHAQMTLQAFEAGKHVLCEKPMATSLEDARKMLDTSRRTGLIGMIDHEFRYVPARAYAKELIDNGWLGPLYLANITMLTGTSADPKGRRWGWMFDREAGGGFLGALGSHYIDALRVWFGEIAAVAAEIETYVRNRHLPDSDDTRAVSADDNFTLLCRFARGGRAVVNVAVVAQFGPGERIELYGQRGSLILDNEGRIFGGRAGEERLQLLNIPARFTDGPSSNDPRLRPFVTLSGQFVEAIRAAKKTGRNQYQEISPSFADGFKVQQVIEAARQSAETKGWISLPPPK